MADSKITALTALTAADPANDMMPIVDVSDTSMAASGTTKRISINNILACSPSATLASATITGDLTVDTSTLKVDSANDRVGFGTASPAQFVHLSKSSTSTALTAPPVGGASLRIQNTSSTNNNFGSVEFYNANGLFGGSVNCQFTNQATPTNDLVFVTRGSSGGLEHYRIAADGVCTWSEVGGVAGTAMTLNSTGLGVGVTPSAWGGAFKALQINRAGLRGSTATSGLSFNAYNDGSGFKYIAASLYASDYYQNSGKHVWQIAGVAANANDPVTFTEAMTLDASGNLLVGKTATDYLTVGCEIKPLGAFNCTQSGSTNANTAWDTYSTGASAYRFYVGMAGTVFATNTTISAISDARLKENVQDIDVGLGAILALKPRKFDWKEGKGKNIKGDRGFIAQEFEAVFPQLVDEWRDPAPEGEASYKSVRQDLIPVLVKAIQELTARVEALEA